MRATEMDAGKLIISHKVNSVALYFSLRFSVGYIKTKESICTKFIAHPPFAEATVGTVTHNFVITNFDESNPDDEAIRVIVPGFFVDFTITKHLPCHALRCGNW